MVIIRVDVHSRCPVPVSCSCTTRAQTPGHAGAPERGGGATRRTRRDAIPASGFAHSRSFFIISFVELAIIIAGLLVVRGLTATRPDHG